MLLNGFLLLYVNSDHQSKLWRTSVLNTRALCSAAVTLSIKRVLSCHCDRLWRHASALVWGANTSVYICMCLRESGDDATSIFSSVHWVLPLCYAALFLGQATGSSAAAESTVIAPALLPDPGPPAPTSVGETYKIPWRHLGEAICKKEALSWRMPCSSTSFSLRWLMG